MDIENPQLSMRFAQSIAQDGAAVPASSQYDQETIGPPPRTAPSGLGICGDNGPLDFSRIDRGEAPDDFRDRGASPSLFRYRSFCACSDRDRGVC